MAAAVAAVAVAATTTGSVEIRLRVARDLLAFAALRHVIGRGHEKQNRNHDKADAEHQRVDPDRSAHRTRLGISFRHVLVLDSLVVGWEVVLGMGQGVEVFGQS